MLINDEIEIERINKKLKAFFDIEKYSDFLFLTFEEFESKYGHYGFSFVDFIAVRFNAETSVFTEISDLLPENEYYFIPLKKNSKDIHKMEMKYIREFAEQNEIVNFVI